MPKHLETVWMAWIVFVLLITLFRKTGHPVPVPFFTPFSRMEEYYNDFVMRASIPALFILMTYCVQYMPNCSKAKQTPACLVMTAVFFIGAATPAVEYKWGFRSFV